MVEAVKRTIEPEFPSKDAVQLYGALSFLYFRSPRHRNWPLHAIRRVVQPPIDLSQVRIFYQDGIPRGAVTWAFLGEDAERRIMDNQMLEPAQWRSGKSFWLMDVLAPYEQGSAVQIMRWVKKNLPDSIDRFRFARIGADGAPKRIVESRRLRGASWGARVLSDLA